MRKLPPLNALRAFEAAGRHLSFTKAADELNVTPAAISQQIRTLEDFIGTPLFRRVTRALFLTDTGQEALPLLAEGFDRLEDAADRMKARETAGLLTVSAAPSFAAKWLVHRLHRFQEQYPDINIRLDATLNIIDFDRDRVDIAIRFGLGKYPGMHVTHLMNEDIGPVCSPELMNGPKPLRKPEDLQHHTLIHVDWGAQEEVQPDWSMWLKAAGAENIDARKGPVFTTEVLAIEAALDSHGVALINQSIIQQDLDRGRLVRPYKLALSTNFGIHFVCPMRTAEMPKIAAFREWILTEIEQSGLSRTKGNIIA